MIGWSIISQLLDTQDSNKIIWFLSLTNSICTEPRSSMTEKSVCFVRKEHCLKLGYFFGLVTEVFFKLNNMM